MTLQLQGVVNLASYSLVSSNDVPARDPRKWDIRFNIAEYQKEFVKEQYGQEQIDFDGNLLIAGVETTAWTDRFMAKNFVLKVPVYTDRITITFRSDYPDFDPKQAAYRLTSPGIQI